MKEDKKEYKLKESIKSDLELYFKERTNAGSGEIDWLHFANQFEYDYLDIEPFIDTEEFEEYNEKMLKIEKIFIEREIRYGSLQSHMLNNKQDRILQINKLLGKKENEIVFRYGKITGIQKMIEERRAQIEKDIKE